MAASMIIEEESGVFSGLLHTHNGYYAGDFGSPAQVSPGLSPIATLATFAPQS